jgi:hypothetical protein
MVVEFTTTCAISAYHHKRREFESRSSEVYSIQHSMINLVVICDRSLVFSNTSGSSTNNTDCHDIAEILLKVVLNTINQTILGYFPTKISGNMYCLTPYEQCSSYIMGENTLHHGENTLHHGENTLHHGENTLHHGENTLLHGENTLYPMRWWCPLCWIFIVLAGADSGGGGGAPAWAPLKWEIYDFLA